MALPPAESADVTNLQGEQSRASAASGQQPTWGGARGHLCVLLGCRRTKRPRGLGFQLQEWGPGDWLMVSKPSPSAGLSQVLAGRERWALEWEGWW